MDRDDRLGPRLPHLPALDGMRTVALGGVLLFHNGFAWIRGGYLPLTSFFVLSGFLITALLLCERERTGRIDLVSFWGRRARRLVPASLLALGLIGLYLGFGARDRIPGVEGDALAALTWWINWRFVFADRVYADAFSAPSPFQHLWSLAVEEQLYLVLPLLAIGLLGRRSRRRGRLGFGVVVAVGVAASVAAIRFLHEPGEEPLRSYYGTDARAAEPLIGVLLALVLVNRRGLRSFAGTALHAVDAIGLVALAVTVALWFRVTAYSDWLFEGGLALVALLAVPIVVAGTQRRTVTARLLGWRPLAEIGQRSYGIYLYHWPVFVWLDVRRTGLDGWGLFALRMAVVLPMAWASHRLVETPIRLGRLRPRVALIAWGDAALAGVAALLLASTAASPLGITLDSSDVAPPTIDAAELAAPLPGATAVWGILPTTAAAPDTPTASTAASPDPGRTSPARSEPGPSPTEPVGAAPTTPGTTAPVAQPGRRLRVAVTGDSQGKNLATGLKAWAPSAGAVVFDATTNGCTISRGGRRRVVTGIAHEVPAECGWWADRASPRYQNLVTFKPDVLVVLAGMNDSFDRSRAEWGGTFRGPGDPQYDEWVRSEWAAAGQTYRALARTVVWVNPPCNDWTKHPEWATKQDGDRRIRSIQQGVLPHALATGTFSEADLDEQLCPGGQYVDDPLGIRNARPDGFHLSDTAAGIVAQRWLGPLLVEAVART